MTKKRLGWRFESQRHALASRGIKTTFGAKGVSREKEKKIFGAFYNHEKMQEIIHDFYEGDIHPDIEWYINYNYDIQGEIVTEDGGIEIVDVKVGTPSHGYVVFIEWEHFPDVTSRESYELDVREEILPAYSMPGVDFVDSWLETEGYYNEEILDRLDEEFMDDKLNEFELWMRNMMMQMYAEYYLQDLREKGFDIYPKYDNPKVYVE